MIEDHTEPSLQALADNLAERVEVPTEPDHDYTAPHIVIAPLPPAVPPAAPAPFVPEPLPSEEPEFDADIAAIFSEEASELLEQADASLLNWTRDRADRAQVTELKRLLHTLKGGARMAGIRAMGDLSHEMESFLAALESGTVASDQDAIGVLQASLDELHRMRDTVNAGQRIAPALGLIERVHAVAAASSRAPVPMEAPVPPEGAEVVEAVEAAAPEAAPAPIEEPAGAEGERPGIEVAPVEEAAWVAAAPVAPEQAWEEVAAAAPEVPFVEQPAVEAFVAAPAEAAAPVAPVEMPMLPGREPSAPAERHELARVDADLLDELLNNAGEVSIFRARVEQQMSSIDFNLAELDRTVTRLREQLRKLELETEAQILFKHQGEAEGRADFDPLELDRYSTIQQLSRALAESVSDVASIEGLLENLNREAQNLLQQQGRVVTDLQNGLMRTRMVPFQRHVQRLSRLVRQVAQETGKQVELVVEGASGELDRQVLERMLPPFEHMLRNAVVHGIESPEERRARGKPESGTRRGAPAARGRRGGDHRRGRRRRPERRSDPRQGPPDGPAAPGSGHHRRGGAAARARARLLHRRPADAAGGPRRRHGRGRDRGEEARRRPVHRVDARQGRALHDPPAVHARDQPGAHRAGARRVLCAAGADGRGRGAAAEARDRAAPRRGARDLRVRRPVATASSSSAMFLGSGPSVLPESDVALPVILVRAGEHSTALVTDELVGSREIVVKSVGPQMASVRGISGATILGDGRIVIILDIGALVRSEWRARPAEASVRPTRDERIFALVVDDSITVRRVTQRLLERNGMRVLTAKDGVEAMALLQEHVPDVILLDIEMPRMDGYEVAAHVRNDPRLADVPIIMITSRVGEKHRARAIELGVDDYLGKPYQESQLLDAIEPLVLARRRQPL